MISRSRSHKAVREYYLKHLIKYKLIFKSKISLSVVACCSIYAEYVSCKDWPNVLTEQENSAEQPKNARGNITLIFY